MSAEAENSYRWWHFGLVGILLSMFILFALGLGRDTKLIPSPLIGKTAFNFNLEKLDGSGKLQLSDLKGTGVVMNFWASWCVSCRDEHHALLDVANQFKDDKSIQFVGVNHKDRPDAAKAFMKKLGQFPYPSIIDGQGRLGLEYGVYGMPETFFIDKDGIVVAKHIGPLTKQKLLEKIKLIGGAP